MDRLRHALGLTTDFLGDVIHEKKMVEHQKSEVEGDYKDYRDRAELEYTALKAQYGAINKTLDFMIAKSKTKDAEIEGLKGENVNLKWDAEQDAFMKRYGELVELLGIDKGKSHENVLSLTKIILEYKEALKKSVDELKKCNKKGSEACRELERKWNKTRDTITSREAEANSYRKLYNDARDEIDCHVCQPPQATLQTCIKELIKKEQDREDERAKTYRKYLKEKAKASKLNAEKRKLLSLINDCQDDAAIDISQDYQAWLNDRRSEAQTKRLNNMRVVEVQEKRGKENG